MNKIVGNKKIIYFTLGLGITLIVLGIFFIIAYFNHETIDNAYFIKEVTEYKSDNVSLKDGEVIVTKDIKYIGEGKYKITYKNKVNNNSSEVLDKESTFTISDSFGDGYELDKENIVVNGTKLSMDDTKIITENYDISYVKNKLEVTIPSEIALKENKIEVYIKLVGRNTKEKYEVSRDSYYTFKPSNENSFYQKKSMQSYIIEGSCYIVLIEK